MSKRNSWIGVAVLGTALGLVSFGLAASDIQVYANGKPIACEVPPRVVEGVTYLPLRATAEALGAKLEWVAGSKTAVLCRGDLCYPVRVADPASEARIISGRVVLPLRKLAEALGCEIKWDGEAGRVEVTVK